MSDTYSRSSYDGGSMTHSLVNFGGGTKDYNDSPFKEDEYQGRERNNTVVGDNSNIGTFIPLLTSLSLCELQVQKQPKLVAERPKLLPLPQEVQEVRHKGEEAPLVRSLFF